MPGLARRRFLYAVGSAGVYAGLGGISRLGFAQQSAAQLAATPLRDGLLLVAGAGGNLLAHGGPDGLLLVDSGGPEDAESLAVLLAERFAARPVTLLFNTHWHLEHTGGNEHVADASTAIIAHEHTRLWMSTKFYVEWQDRRYLPRPAEALPNRTFFSSDPQPLEIDFDGTTVVYGHLREAHTDGDIYVQFPNSNVIVAGGAVTVNRFPVLDYITGGWVGGLMDATQALIDLSDDDTLIVPDSGPVQRRDDLRVQYDMLAAVRERVEAMALRGLGIDDMIAADLTAAFDARYRDGRDLFIKNMYQGLWWNRLRAI